MRGLWRYAVAAAVLLAVAVMTFSLATAAADPAACSKNLKSLSMAVMMYAQNYDNTLPPMKNTVQLQRSLLRYVKNRAIFNCPVTKAAYAPNPALHCKELAKVKKPGTVEMLYDSKPHGGMRTVAYADGKVKAVKAPKGK